MPLMHRNFDDPVRHISENVDHLVKESAKSMFHFLTCGGAPGIGKTRYGIELFNYLQTKWAPPTSWTSLPPHFEYIILDFGNEVVLDSQDPTASSSIILGLRLAWAFFIKRYDISFADFRMEALKSRELFQLGPVITRIRESLKLEVDQRLFLFLHVDEFQAIFEFERKLLMEGLFKSMQRDLGAFMTGTTFKKTFMQTFFSGTEKRSIVATKQASAYSWTFVECPLLPLADRVQIMRHFSEYYGFDDKKWILEPWIHHLLSDTGGLPRALEILFDEFFGSSHDSAQKFYDKIARHDARTFFEAVAGRLDVKYGIKNFARKHRNLALQLVYRSLGSIPTKKDDVLSTDDIDHGLSLEVLESDHHLILKGINDEEEVLIQLPFLFVYLYNKVLGIVDGSLAESFYPKRGTYWQAWEVFLAEFEAFRNNLLIRMGKETLQLRDIYRGAYGSEETLNRHVKLFNLSVAQSRQQFPKTMPIFDDHGKPLDWKNNVVVINGASAPFSDCFLLRKKAEPADKDLLVGLQAKLKKKAVYIRDIRDEHTKNKNAASKDFQYYHVITVVITTQRLGEGEQANLAELGDDCLLICWHNFVEYFGEIFASRANLEMASLRNPNFGDPAHLMRSDQMDGTVAADIKWKRPYSSLNDLYEKVPWAKNHAAYFGFDELGGFSFYPYDDSLFNERPQKISRWM